MPSGLLIAKRTGRPFGGVSSRQGVDKRRQIVFNKHMSNAHTTEIPARTLLVLDELLVEVYCDTCDSRSAHFVPAVDPGDCPECEGDRTVYVPQAEVPARRLLNEAIVVRNGRQFWTAS